MAGFEGGSGIHIVDQAGFCLVLRATFDQIAFAISLIFTVAFLHSVAPSNS